MHNRNSSLLAIAIGACIAAPIHGHAQTASRASAGLEEVIVTAQKRAESLQDTPISMMALTSDSLENRGINDLFDLRAEVPSLQVTPHPNSATTARVFIRGVGNNDDQVTQDPSVAVYLDGVYIARSQGLAMEVAELERIEVLRGPQGSLYGRNATGGAINYISRGPELGEFGFKQSLTFGNYDLFRSRTRVNIPVSDTVAVELAYLRSQKDGYVDNLGTGVKRWGDQRRDAYRAALRWTPTDSVDVRYSYDRSEIEDTPPFIAHVPFYPEQADRPRDGSPFVQDLRRNDVMTQGHNLTVSWDVNDKLSIKSITAYRELENAPHQNYLSGVLGPFPVLVVDFDQEQDQFTQEIQVVGSALDDQLEYVLGAYYFDESANSFDHNRVTGQPRLLRTVTTDNTAYALYGQATFRPAFLDDLYVTPSIRWSRDERKAKLYQTSVPAIGAPTVLPTGVGDEDFSNVSPGLVVGFDVTHDINVYAKWARGYKSGGYNIRASSIPSFEQGFDPEELNAYEVGMKSSWFEDRLRFNVAGFLSKYDDIQTSLQSHPTNPRFTDTFNAGKATIKGVELDLTARPTSKLTARISYAYLDAEYDKIVDPITGVNIADDFNFVETPKRTLAASLEYELFQTPIGVLTAYVDYFRQSKKYTVPNDPLYVIDSYDLVDARLTLSDIPVGFGSWRVSAFGKNLTDEEYYASHFISGPPSAIFGDPRTYGLEIIFEY